MKQGIVIVTWGGGVEQLELLLQSLRGYHKYPIYIYMNDIARAPVSLLFQLEVNFTVLASKEDLYESGAFHSILQLTDLDEFVLLQDTVEIKRPIVFDQLFKPEGMSISFGPNYFHFLGKFRREILEKIEIPETRSKIDAIYAELHTLIPSYLKAEGPDNVKVLFPDFNDNQKDVKMEQRWGRTVRVLENRYLIKRKTFWSET